MPDAIATQYDATIIGAGHNGLVAACYLAKAGLSVLVLERNETLGGATQSTRPFDGLDANLSVYSYLVSLFPEKIVDDLGLDLQLASRKVASYTPSVKHGQLQDLLIRNGAEADNRDAFRTLTGGSEDYEGVCRLQAMQEQIASVIWPSLTRPLVSKQTLRASLDQDGAHAWQSLIEEPLGLAIEKHISHDLIRGLVFTDGKIGISTHPHDPSRLQNRSFLYHVIGRGTGEWRVPIGGMGNLVTQLACTATVTGNVNFATHAEVTQIHPDEKHSTITFEQDGKCHEVDTRFVLCNASAQILDKLLAVETSDHAPNLDGAGFKVNMLLKHLPKLRSDRYSAAEAFAGTFHINEGYEQMNTAYKESMSGNIPTTPPGEIYCHTLTDNSILSDELNQQGYHTLTLFGLDMPYPLFKQDNAAKRAEVLSRYLAGINQFLEDPIEDCLAIDQHGAPCIEAKSAVDLERSVHLPRGNIFHGDLSWPFAERDEEVGQWGVETSHANILLCGSAAKRGGAVSGIPGHNAAMKILEML